LLKSPTSLLVCRTPVDHRLPTVPNKISYQLVAETNFRIRTLQHADRPYTTPPPPTQHTEKRRGAETKGTGGEQRPRSRLKVRIRRGRHGAMEKCSSETNNFLKEILALTWIGREWNCRRGVAVLCS